MGEYLLSASAFNFLACRIILDIKTALDKGTSRKSSTGDPQSSIPTSPSGLGSNSGGVFGIDGFVSSGGNSDSLNKDYDLPKPQFVPSFKPVDIVIPKQDSNSNTIKEQKNCIVCAASIPKHAKFCNKCGNSQ